MACPLYVREWSGGPCGRRVGPRGGRKGRRSIHGRSRPTQTDFILFPFERFDGHSQNQHRPDGQGQEGTAWEGLASNHRILQRLG